MILFYAERIKKIIGIYMQNSFSDNIEIKRKEEFVSQLFLKLVNIIKTLRSPEGCPWDREQTLYSLKNHFIEEAYELVDALDNRDIDNIKEELGDLLLHIVIHSIIAEEDGYFTINEVIQEISEKLVRRHPHVFADTKVKNTDEVMKNWEAIKSDEGKKKKSVLDGIPKGLPSIQQSYKMQKRVSKKGFDWNTTEDCMNKVDEEYNELKEAVNTGNKEEIQHELGDVLFAVINLSRFLNVDPDEALRNVNKRFTNRFMHIEKKLEEKGQSLENTPLEEMEAFWQEAKKEK